MSHKIVFLDRETLDANVRIPNFPHEYTEYAQTPVDQIVERAKDADIVITNKVPLREPVLKQLPKLKLIAVAATGTDVIDKAYTTANGITVSNIRNYAFNTLPEHVFALLFALRRNLVNYVDSVRRGRWGYSNQFCYFDYPIYDIAGSTLGIVGYGALGRETEKRAQALGMKVLVNDLADIPGKVDLPTILRESDVITLNIPLTPQTRNLIGAKELGMMKKSASIINTARGGIIDEEALADADQALRKNVVIDNKARVIIR
jgi:glycerate dehydrogenase